MARLKIFFCSYRPPFGQSRLIQLPLILFHARTKTSWFNMGPLLKCFKSLTFSKYSKPPNISCFRFRQSFCYCSCQAVTDGIKWNETALSFHSAQLHGHGVDKNQDDSTWMQLAQVLLIITFLHQPIRRYLKTWKPKSKVCFPNNMVSQITHA